MATSFVCKIYNHFEEVTDPRVNRGANHPPDRDDLPYSLRLDLRCRRLGRRSTLRKCQARLASKVLSLRKWDPIARYSWACFQSALHSISAWACGLQEVLNTTLLKAMDNEDPKLRRCQSGETTRRRAEIREVVVLPAPNHCSVLAGWEGIKTIGLIYRSREINGQVQESSETFISSLAPKVRDHAKRIREHWGIENKQHWILDVTFSEDSSRIRKRSSPEISSVFRRLALSILQRDTSIKDNIRGRRKRCSWDNSMIERLIKHFSSI